MDSTQSSSISLDGVRQLIASVNEKSLDKNKLEDYYTQLSNTYADIQFAIADVKKLRAGFFIENGGKDVSDISVKRRWEATEEGLRLVDLEASAKAISRILSSIKSRLYNVY